MKRRTEKFFSRRRRLPWNQSSSLDNNWIVDKTHNGLYSSIIIAGTYESIILIDSLIQYLVIRYRSPDGFYIDLIIKIGNAFTFDYIKIVTMYIEGHTIHITSPHTRYKMKCDTVRPIDKSD